MITGGVRAMNKKVFYCPFDQYNKGNPGNIVHSSTYLTYICVRSSADFNASDEISLMFV